MADLLTLFEDVAAFVAAPPTRRARAKRELVARLGRDWEEAPAPRGLAVLHRPTGLAFAVVPGGALRMGLRDDDVEAARVAVRWSESHERWIAAQRDVAGPVHDVHVRPFLASREVLSEDDVPRLTRGQLELAMLEREEARHLARGLELRLPSEAELEWLARDGAALPFTLDAARAVSEGATRERELRSRFSVTDLGFAQWAGDDWHESYRGAPATSAAWMEGDARGVMRGAFSIATMQDSEELLLALAGRRIRGAGRAWVRLARDFPYGA